MNGCAREQCQPLFTRGLPLPAADLSESSRELLKSLALPDQRSSTDFKPRNSPLRLPEGARESLKQKLDAALRASRLGLRPLGGGCPLPAMDCQIYAAEILENSGETSAGSAKRSVTYPSWVRLEAGLRSVRSSGIRAETRRAGKRTSILPRPVC